MPEGSVLGLLQVEVSNVCTSVLGNKVVPGGSKLGDASDNSTIWLPEDEAACAEIRLVKWNPDSAFCPACSPSKTYRSMVFGSSVVSPLGANVNAEGLL